MNSVKNTTSISCKIIFVFKIVQTCELIDEELDCNKIFSDFNLEWKNYFIKLLIVDTCAHTDMYIYSVYDGTDKRHRIFIYTTVWTAERQCCYLINLTENNAPTFVEEDCHCLYKIQSLYLQHYYTHYSHIKMQAQYMYSKKLHKLFAIINVILPPTLLR